MNNKNSWGLINFVAIIILGAILIFGGSLLGSWVSQNQSDKDVAGIENFQPIVEKVVAYDGQDGKTALELLKEGRDVQTQDSSIGVFVTSIDGAANSEDTYWMFYVDDQLAPTGADQYQTQTGEKIEWRFEKLQ